MNLVQEVCQILDENLVSYRDMRFDSLDTSRHNIITDHEQVFVKLLRPENNPLLLQHEVDFAAYTGYGTNPLLDQVEHRTRSGWRLFFSAWEWEQRWLVGLTLNPMQAAQAARELHRIHESPKYPELVANAQDEYHTYGEYLSSLSFTYLTADSQSRLKDIYMGIVQPYTTFLETSDPNHVVVHGRPTPEKLMMRDDYSLFWVDYEDSRSAPREYDLAYLYLHLNHRMNRPDLWQIFLRSYEQVHGNLINEDLLDKFNALLLARRSLHVASKTLHTMNETKLTAFLKDLEPLLHNTKVRELQTIPGLH